MANPGSILGQIGESFEQIGQDVARETVQAPKDIVGTALESLGGSSGQKKQGKTQQAAASQPTGPQTPEQAQHDESMKRAVARAALQALSGGGKPKELSVWEQKIKEEEQKKEMETKQREEAKKHELPMPASKRSRGDLFGKKAKQTQIENKGKRQD